VATIKHTLVIPAATPAEWVAVLAFLDAGQVQNAKLPGWSRVDNAAKRTSTITYNETKTDWTIPPVP
jgi:hypothetical protein